MNGKRNSLLTVLLLISIIFQSSTFLQSAADEDIEEFVPTPEYEEIRDLIDSVMEEETLDKALDKIEQVCRAHPHTALAAECKLLAIKIWGLFRYDDQKVLKIYEEMADEYEGTRYGICGLAGIIDVKYYRGITDDFMKWQEEKDKLLTQFGGVSIYKIFRSHYGKNFYKYIDFLTLPAKRHLPAEYIYAGNVFRGKERNDLTKSLKLYMFARMHFPKDEDIDSAMGGIKECFYEKLGIWDREVLPDDTTPPVIKLLLPPKKMPVFHKRPKIKLLLYDGIISQAQVALEKLVFTLDGNDITDKMKVKIIIDPVLLAMVFPPGKAEHTVPKSKIDMFNEVKRFFESLEKNEVRTFIPKSKTEEFLLKKIFESIYISYRPEADLAPGEHTIRVEAPDYAGFKSSIDYSFTIFKKPCRPKK